MAIEINGKIYRNVKGGSEGVFIDGEPIGGGGTQLYKHKVSFDLDFSGDTQTVSGEFITTSETSLVGKMFNGAGQFISGMMAYNESYCPIFYIDGYTVACFDASNQTFDYVDMTGNFLSDKVTKL